LSQELPATAHNLEHDKPLNLGKQMLSPLRGLPAVARPANIERNNEKSKHVSLGEIRRGEEKKKKRGANLGLQKNLTNHQGKTEQKESNPKPREE